MKLETTIETFALKEPFSITGYTVREVEVVVVTLGDGDVTGRGEATGVYYKNDTAAVLRDRIEAVRAEIEASPAPVCRRCCPLAGRAMPSTARCGISMPSGSGPRLRSWPALPRRGRC